MQADSWGVSYGYRDGADVFHEAKADVRRAIHRSMNAPDDGSGAPVATRAVQVLLPGESFEARGQSEIRHENGSAISLGNGRSIDYATLGPGYHAATTMATGETTRLIVSPGACHVDPDLHTWGWAVQLYALRSTDSWGFGDFRDLRRLNEWSVRHGSSMVLINPLHAPSPVASPQPSPYFPTTRIAKSPLHLCIEEVPGWDNANPELRATAAVARALNNDRRIDRDRVYAAKIEALTALWGTFDDAGSAERDAFERFAVERSGALGPIATFFALVELHGGDWRQWPSSLRDSSSSDVTAFARNNDRVRFHLWVQWLLDSQLRWAGSVGERRFDVMTDLAIGCDRAGADAWVHPSAFCLDMSVGAPPDAFNQLGQNWGLPPFDPWGLRELAYEPFVQTVRAALAGAGALRMDHVMGLFRLYWIPEGFSAKNGCYVYLPFRDLLAIVALESQRAGAYVVGEDLGTVESYVREELSRAKVFGYQLLQFEPGTAASMRTDVLAAFTTHDLPTIPGLWTGSDLHAQLELSLRPNVDGVEAIRTSIAERAKVRPDDPNVSVDDVVLGVYRNLAEAPCALLNATLDDALGVEERPNMPGTIDEWPNWRIGLPVPLEAILEDPRVAAIAEALTRGTTDPTGHPRVEPSAHDLPGGSSDQKFVEHSKVPYSGSMTTISLTASDGHELAAYVAEPAATPTAGIVVIQEIFGVNAHIQEDTDRFAAAGYLAVAPHMFDRVKRGVSIGYTAETIAEGRDYAMALKPEGIAADVSAAISYLRTKGVAKVGIVGYCFGGTVSAVAAANLDVDAAVSYYGGGVGDLVNSGVAPKVPTICHFGMQDVWIPVEVVDAVTAAWPDVTVYRYDANHGFHCDHRADFNQAASDEAQQRTLSFFADQLS